MESRSYQQMSNYLSRVKSENMTPTKLSRESSTNKKTEETTIFKAQVTPQKETVITLVQCASQPTKKRRKNNL